MDSITTSRMMEITKQSLVSLLFVLLEQSQQGDSILFEELGIDATTASRISSLNPHELFSIAEQYASKVDSTMFSINSASLDTCINQIDQQKKQLALSDNLLRLGACKDTMHSLFGMRSSEIANRKKRLGICSSKGRRRKLSMRQNDAICMYWRQYKDLYSSAKVIEKISLKTGINASSVFKEVEHMKATSHIINSAIQKRRQNHG